MKTLPRAFAVATRSARVCLATSLALLGAGVASAAQIASANLYEVVDIAFTGPQQGPTSSPTNIDFWARIQHSSGSPTYKIYGFWDGNGQGGSSGNVFKIRFAGTQPGTWTIIETNAPGTPLHDQRENDTITVSSTAANPGFWTVDPSSANGGWFKRSNGSHPYIVGTTYYNFLHRPGGTESSPASVRSDIDAAASRFNKVRFGLSAPGSGSDSSALRPFFDSNGNQTDIETDRPNPAFFTNRVDVAVKRGAEHDMICDLILEMGGDPLGSPTRNQLGSKPAFHKYVAARYGAYANVWFCLGNEAAEDNSASVINAAGQSLASYLAYGNPLSVHMVRGWLSGLGGGWYTHAINQFKLDQHLPSRPGTLAQQADIQIAEFNKFNVLRPVINDECAYDPGEATELHTLESVVGCLMGGAYASTGNKFNGSKASPYFQGYAARGVWTIADHASSDNLGWFRPLVDQYLDLKRLSPATPSIFGNLNSQFRALAWSGNQYVLGTNGNNGGTQVTANLPTGTWSVRQLNLVGKTNTLLSSGASGTYSFAVPNSKAAITILTKVSGGTPPAAPSALSATGVSSAQINLTWNDNSSNESIFRLERRPTGSTTWASLATPAPDTTFYADSAGLSANASYEYRVRAENGNGSSTYATATGSTLAANSTLITSPAPGATFSPRQSVTLSGTGSNLGWTVSGVVNATGTGSSINVTIPTGAANNSTLTAALSGSGGNDTRTWTIVDTSPVVTTSSAELAPATVGAAYRDDLEATGDAPTTVSLASGSLPPGLSISDNSLVGTPTSAGNYSFAVRATDHDGDTSAPVTLSLAVAGGSNDSSITETFATAGLTSGYANGSFTGQGGLVWTYTVASSATLNGAAIRLDDAGSGPGTLNTTLAHGLRSLSLKLSNRTTGSTTQLQLLVNGAVIATSPSVSSGTQSWNVSGLNYSGSTSVRIVCIAQSSALVDDITLVTQAGTDTTPVVTTRSTDLAPATVGAAYTTALQATGDAPVTIALASGGLPPGLSLSNNTLSGTPTTAGTYSFALVATDGDGDTSAPVTLSLSVAEGSGGASITETFATASFAGAYTNGSFTGQGGLVWNFTLVSSATLNGAAARLDDPGSGPGVLTTTVANGLERVSIKYATGNPAVAAQVRLFVNGTLVGTSPGVLSGVQTWTVPNLNYTGNTAVRLECLTSAAVLVDDITLVGKSGPGGPSDLVSNGGFESDLQSWMNWGRASTTLGGMSGKAVLIGNLRGGVGQDLNGWKAGSTYTLRASARLSAVGDNLWIGVKGGGAQDYDFHVAFSATQFETKSTTFTLPAGTTWAQLFVWKNDGSGAYAYADDISVIEN